MLAYSLIVAARIAGAAGSWATAVQLQAKASAMLEETGQRPYDDDLRASEQLLVDCRTHLGDLGFENARRAGLALHAPAAASLAERVFVAAGGIGTGPPVAV